LNTEIVLIHGALGCAAQLGPLAQRLGSAARVHVLELSGHGLTPYSGSFGITAFSNQLQGFIEVHCASAPLVFGYSMGGYVALYLAATMPDSVRGVITLGTKYAWNPEQAQREAQMLHLPTLREKVPSFAQNLSDMHGPQLAPLLEHTAEMMLALGNAPVLTSTLLNRIKCPVHVCVGDTDRMVSRDETEAMAAAIPGATLHILPQTKHPIEAVDPTLIEQVIMAALLA
jgi:pimeloyl-ACP methyl ester carboxylesterase